MSYDISFDIDAGGTEPVEIGGERNYTSNVSGMWAEALGGRRLSELKDWRCLDAIPLLKGAVEHMRAQPDHYRKMNPENGWGDYEGALETLQWLLDSCRRHPLACIRIWH
jgi:hypothetical protein